MVWNYLKWKKYWFHRRSSSEICDSIDFRYPAFIAELELEPLSDLLNERTGIKPVGKFPPTSRDISLVVSQDVVARDIMNSIGKHHEWISDVKFVEVFKGIQIGPDKKSVTFSITFQNQERTLTDEEVNGLMEKLIADFKRQYQAELR